MKVEAERRAQGKREVPEVEQAGRAEEEKGGHESLGESMKRLRQAAESGQEPLPRDVELAQLYLGNSAVAAILAGEDAENQHKSAAAGQDNARYHVAVYVRERFSWGSSDPGQAFIVLEGLEKEKPIYGFRPQQAGPGALRPGGVTGDVADASVSDQLVDAVRTRSIELTFEQLEAIRVQAEAFDDSPPSYDFWKWNSVDFVVELLTHAGVQIPYDVFEKVASPEEMRIAGFASAAAPVVEQDDGGDDDDDGAGEPPPDPNDEEEPNPA